LRKLDSGEELGLVLRRNSKILDRLKSYSAGRSIIVGFKLTSTHDQTVRRLAVEKVASSGNVDLVVHNDFGEIRSGSEHVFYVHPSRGGQVQAGKTCTGVDELGVVLLEQFKKFL
jgi:hypothetical protein